MIARRFVSFCAPILMCASLLTSCKESNPAEPSGSPLVGVWQVVKVAGKSGSLLGGSWTFTENQSTYRQAVNDCVSTFTYKLSNGKMLSTTVQDGCVGGSVGVTDTIAYTITGNRLMLTVEGATIELEKLATPRNTPLKGKWQVQKVDGEAPASGTTMMLDFTWPTLTITTSNGTGASCETVFDYDINIDDIYLEVISDECTGLEEGTTDIVTASIDANTLTMKFSDGTEMIATKK